MNKQKGISLLVIILIIVGVAVVAGGGILIYQHYYSNPKSAACTPNWKCGWGPCIIPPCVPGSDSSACTNGSQSQVAVDSNNCGLPSSSAKIACPALSRICTSSNQPSISTTGLSVSVGGQVELSGSNINTDINAIYIDGVQLSAGSFSGYSIVDNNALAFFLPTSVAAGSHTLYLTNSSGKSNTITFTVTPASPNQPSITFISPNPAKIGSAVAVTGANLNGFEGDKNLWIENSAGQKGIIYGARDNSTATIKFTLAGNYCTADTSYSGLPCPSSINIIPGTYNIYAVTPSGTSNKVSFTVSSTSTQPSITVISPNGGETFVKGKDIVVRWESQGIDKVTIRAVYYNSNNIANVITNEMNQGECRITYEPIPAATGTFTIVGGNTGRCGVLTESSRIKIQIDGGTFPNVISDLSDNYFSIVAPTTATCIDSDGGKNYNQKGTVTLNGNTYTDECTAGNNLKEWTCEFNTNGQSIVNYYNYSCPSGCSSGACVPADAPTITITSPKGGEQWAQGSTHNITWDTTGLAANDKVHISITAPCMGPNCLLYNVTSSDVSALSGSYSWAVPYTLGVYNSYIINITSSTNNSVQDGIMFSIVAP